MIKEKLHGLIKIVAKKADKRCSSSYCDLDDFIQIGYEALLKACRTWKGTGCFCKYASTIIIRDINDIIRKIKKQDLLAKTININQSMKLHDYSILNDLLSNKCLTFYERKAINNKLRGYTKMSLSTLYRHINSARYKLIRNGYMNA